MIDQYVNVGYCETISDLYASEGWDKAIPQGLIDQCSKDGEQYLIPVGVHRGNGLWYNKDILRRRCNCWRHVDPASSRPPWRH